MYAKEAARHSPVRDHPRVTIVTISASWCEEADAPGVGTL
ncbi:MAG: hypothetical protein OJF49_001344 [Ktedonobacterales bacterium]|nr:MAG: hypothetical protein OJF49_001344 [Ktedonobacterales bacterium]